jgi:Flp pilus assembly pilin Flp
MLKKFWNDERGQGMTEYILIVALIAVFAIAMVKFFGGTISNIFSRLGTKIDNETRVEK